MHKFKIGFGYASAHDGEIWNFDLCEDCIEKIVSEFKIKIKPEIDDWLK